MKEREGTLVRPQQSARDAKQIQKASAHVNDLWFPVNDALLEQIKDSLNEGRYNGDVQALVKEISGDFSLFLYALRELSRLIHEEDPDISIPENLSPHRFIEWAGLERLEKILSVSSADISSHTLRAPTRAQSMRLEETMVSVSASQVLAERYSVDPDFAFSASLLRQLGYTLIAWNYPVVYQKAIVESTQGKALDVALTQMFGFSPSLLALNVVKSWELPRSLWASITDEMPAEETESWTDEDEVRAIQATLVKIAKTGEALARANNPTVYPTAARDWDFARAEITQALGPDGMSLVQERLKENCLTYLELVPHVFTPTFILDPEGRIAEYQLKESADRNPFIQQCIPPLAKELTALYAGLKGGEISRESLHTLAKDIVPMVGFGFGCVYTLDPASSLLIPQLAVGKASLKNYPPVDYSTGIPVDAPVSLTAFQSDEPVFRSVLSSGNVYMVHVAAPLGISQRLGVVLLEMRQETFRIDTAQHLLHFKAITQAFNDCLALK